jgi:GTP-binding protein EngB required for normal cell division
MRPDAIPEFAIVGHPNEGKSSVLSTLAEDDSVRVSATPGETVVCQTFPVVIDGQEIIRFVDTPGFQHPREILHQLQESRGNRQYHHRLQGKM